MFQTQIASWMIGRTGPAEERDRTHRIALAEARIADAHRRSARVATPVATRRIDLAAADGGTVSVACCAA